MPQNGWFSPHNFAQFIIASLCRQDCFVTLLLLEVLSLFIFNNTFGSEVSFALLQISLVISSPIHFLPTFQSPYIPCAQLFSHVHPFVTPWTVAWQAPLSMGFSKQEYWSGLPIPFPSDVPHPGIEPASPALAGRFFTTELPAKPHINKCVMCLVTQSCLTLATP